MSSEQGFPNYVAQTNEFGVALYTFVIVYSLLSFLLIAPLVVWGRGNERRQALGLAEDAFDRGNVSQDFVTNGLGQQPPRQEHPLQETQIHANLDRIPFEEAANQRAVQSEQGPTASRTALEDEVLSDPIQQQNRVQRVHDSIFRQLDSYATSSYPDNDLDFILSAISGSVRSRTRDSVGMDSSSAPSAATTSRLYCRATQQQPRVQVWDVHGRRWKPRRPIGRAETIHRVIQTETLVMTSAAAHPGASRSTSGRISPPFHRDDTTQVLPRRFGIVNGGPSRFRSRRPRNRRGGSFSSAESGSILPPVEDDITPNDAADAGDPGRPNNFAHMEGDEVTVCCGPNALWKPRILVKAIDGVADLANPDGELKRILLLAIPLTLGAVSDNVFHLIIVALISQTIGADSMAAFLLVSLFLGLSDDLVGSIADAESALCSHALSMGNMHLTGQYVQSAVCFHLIVYAAIMGLSVCYMDAVVEWLVASPDIADIAISYTRISVFQHLLQSLSRTVTFLFHLVDTENFETQADFFEGLSTVVLVACFLPAFGDATLDSVGWIQLTTAIGAFIVKIVYALSRGWSPLFWRGLIRDNVFRVSRTCLSADFVCFCPPFNIALNHFNSESGCSETACCFISAFIHRSNPRIWRSEFVALMFCLYPGDL